MVKGPEKTQYIEELGKSNPVDTKKGTPIVDLDGDGNFGNLGTEVAKMEAEIQKMKQGLSDETGLAMLGELGSILSKIKAGISSGELKMLIEQAMNKKKTVNVEVNRGVNVPNSEKEKREKLEKEIDALFQRLKEIADEKEKNIGMPIVDMPDIEVKRDKPLIEKIMTALKSVFEDKSNKTMPEIDNKDKDKEKNIPIEASIIEQKKKQQNSLTKDGTREPEMQQNEQLIGVIKNLAKAGEVKLLEEVLNDNKDNLQVGDYAKALGKEVTPNMSIDKLKVELKSNARNNRIKKVEAARSIEIHKTSAPSEEKKMEISPRLLRAHEKNVTNEKVQGMERTLDLNNDNNKY